jgi:nodulation protein E
VNRVVITGLGTISPIGQTTKSYWAALTAGDSGFGPPTIFAAERLNTKVVAEVKGFVAEDHFESRQIGLLDRVSQFAVVAAREAITQAGLSFREGLGQRTAAVVGSGIGGQTTQDDAFKRIYGENAARVHPLIIPRTMPNAPASQISMFFGIKGPTYAVSTACASATHSIGQAFHLVRAGLVTCAVTGGAEAQLTHGTVKAWEAMRIVAPDTCRPFSRERKGMVLGEGAAILVLESLDHATARSAHILGEIVGFGMSADAGDLTAPDPDGMVRAMTAALAEAALPLDAVDYVNAHGTGTTANDAAETAALHKAFGAHAPRLAISSTKSMVGHALGAAGALEAVATVMALHDGTVPPTMNYLGPDPACDLDYVPNEARRRPLHVALSNSFAFGGLNAVLMFRRFDS